MSGQDLKPDGAHIGHPKILDILGQILIKKRILGSLQLEKNIKNVLVY